MHGHAQRGNLNSWTSVNKTLKDCQTFASGLVRGSQGLTALMRSGCYGRNDD